MPTTFWQRSLFVKPEDRDVVCHASAWNVDEKDDLRIKMCIKINAEVGGSSPPITTNKIN
jgi:peptidyl-dipeptidase A